MEELDTLVIGAGVIGLAVARELARAGHDVIIAEAKETIGSGISARNSEVIHAGIHYTQGSFKATHCVSGRVLLYEYCKSRHVAFHNCGKLIVATSAAQLGELDGVRARAEANGVADLSFIDRSDAKRLEPELGCQGALVSPSTGIVDGRAFMQSLLGEAEDHGARLALRSKVVRAEVTPSGIRVHLETAGSPSTLLSRHVVNAAGLSAPALSRRFDGLAPEWAPTSYFAKGNYFSLRGASPFARLIYPMPVPGGLGVHVTLDLAGHARFGPDVEWLDEAEPDDLDYAVDPHRADRFYEAVRRYWPGLGDGALSPAYSGIRPKLAPEGAPDRDFAIQGPAAHGVPGFVNLFGIESPGLTASLSIATTVRALLDA